MKIARLAFPLLLVFLFLAPKCGYGQGFGSIIARKKVSLHRKLPAPIHISGKTLWVQVSSHDPRNLQVAAQLADILQTEILKGDSSLRMEPTSADVIISCTITNFSDPPAQVTVRNVTTTKKVGKKTVSSQEPKKSYEVKGALDLTYQVKDAHSGRALDADIVNIKYSQQFEDPANSSDSSSSANSTTTSKITKSLSSFKTPWSKSLSKPSEEKAPMPTQAELEQTMVRQASERISAHMMSKDEVVEVYLARGVLDDSDKMAEAGLWTQMLESLQQMAPLSTPEDDAYRIYNMGVANEALGYKSADDESARAFFAQAEANYSKAVEENPSERYFLDSESRVETAIAHFHKVEQQPLENAENPPATPGDNENGTAKAGTGKKRASSATRSQKSSVTNASLKQNVSSSDTSNSQDSALTNDQVIKLFKAGMDEENLIATIKDAHSTKFDLSVDGQLQLVNAGIKGKLLSAIRQKSALQKSAK